MSRFSSSAGTAPNSMFPKKGGATTMYHAFPRHLSRTCFVLEDKLILRTCLQESQGDIKRFTVLCLSSRCLPCVFLKPSAQVLSHLLAESFPLSRRLFCLWLWLSNSECARTLLWVRLLFLCSECLVFWLGRLCRCCMKSVLWRRSALASKLRGRISWLRLFRCLLCTRLLRGMVHRVFCLVR